jgi:DNA invertase Pin-like site-specific DNA recombinase
MISRRTRDALAAKKAQGVKLGGLNAKGIENRDAAVDRAKQLLPIFNNLRGVSARKIASIATPAGKAWHAATVIRARKRLVD